MNATIYLAHQIHFIMELNAYAKNMANIVSLGNILMVKTVSTIRINALMEPNGKETNVYLFLRDVNKAITPLKKAATFYLNYVPQLVYGQILLKHAIAKTMDVLQEHIKLEIDVYLMFHVQMVKFGNKLVFYVFALRIPNGMANNVYLALGVKSGF